VRFLNRVHWAVVLGLGLLGYGVAAVIALGARG
jgi:hypothetical protein